MTLPAKVHLVKAMFFPVVMYGCESWTIKKAEHWRIDAFELWCWRRLLSPLDCKEIQPVHPKGDQSSIFIGRTDAEAETPIPWPPDAKNWLTGKDPDAGKDWRWEEKGTREDEMVGWHHWLDGHGFGWTPGVGDGQGGLACCSPWGCKVSDTTELNWLRYLLWGIGSCVCEMEKSWGLWAEDPGSYWYDLVLSPKAWEAGVSGTNPIQRQEKMKYLNWGNDTGGEGQDPPLHVLLCWDPQQIRRCPPPSGSPGLILPIRIFISSRNACRYTQEQCFMWAFHDWSGWPIQLTLTRRNKWVWEEKGWVHLDMCWVGGPHGDC